MLIHPQFNPIALQLGPITIHWYGLMYLIGFGLVWVLGNRRIRQGHAPVSKQGLEDLIFYCVAGVVLGGRLGYVVFYKLDYYLAHPIEILYVWEGGMAFHGGLLGVLLAITLYARKINTRFFVVSDFLAPLIPLGLAAGRLGNFINGELWGRATTMPWGMIFPQAQDGGIVRHPSQLYQMGLEGLALFAILWWFSSRPRPVGQTSGLFLIAYGVFRFLAEFTREPDDFLGLLTGGLSMGQILSIPMIAIGVFIYYFVSKSTRSPKH
ncbi:prolipoprotein diacylglyceryl transferase [Paenalcaligenes niemegkensis]|uniref:prolipoprotein diacylglyceryl transferase n=1 Tax=Paenalcaligenes niemegkensis TaxID=2895469 RepID=UPI001EE869F3|nr:prolipoprotein diacylglyceryl transferase [Paenalcaligenes niemegkensis]MCQ9615304.1 prolipoprotein diacylglyceryl transferase [Paenalcaligenes niemegkensis]